MIAKVKEALTVLPSRTIGLTYLLVLAYNSYKADWAIPELLPAVVGFAAIIFSAYIMLEIVMGLTENMYIDMALLGALSYAGAGIIQSVFKIIDTNILTMEHAAFALVFGGMSAAMLFVIRKWSAV